MADRWSNPSGSRFRVWPSGSDSYDHLELAENWDTLDEIIGFPTAQETFGHSTIETNWLLVSDADKIVSTFTIDKTVHASKLTMYVRGETGGPQVSKGIIYADSSGVPGALVATTEEVSIPASEPAAWTDYDFTTPVILTAGTYWLGIHGGTATDKTSIAYGNLAAAGYEDAGDTYAGGAENPWAGGGATARKFCVYATYYTAWPPTEGIGGGIWYEIQRAKEAAVPLGVALPWFRANEDMTIPDGYVLADGSTIEAADHEIPNVVGSYVVPDLRNRFVIGADPAKNFSEEGVDITDGLIDIAIGAPGVSGTGGENATTLTVSQMGAHRHTGSVTGWGPIQWTWFYDGITGPYAIKYPSTGNYNVVREGGSSCTTGVGDGGMVYGQHRHMVTLSTEGEGKPHENRPRYIGLVWLVKVKNVL